MKQVYAVLVLGLALVFALGSVASAGVLPGEDFDRPTGDPYNLEDPDDDHPWGGDRIIGDGDSGDLRTYDPPQVYITTTDYLYVDLWLAQLFKMFMDSDPVVTTTTTIEARPLAEPTYRTVRPVTTTALRPRTYDGKVVSR